eukprot:48860-Prymnesium_polylepis.1
MGASIIKEAGEGGALSCETMLAHISQPKQADMRHDTVVRHHDLHVICLRSVGGGKGGGDLVGLKGGGGGNEVNGGDHGDHGSGKGGWAAP